MNEEKRMCEAICICVDGGAGLNKRGAQCTEIAQTQICGRWLCWNHRTAVQNPNRPTPVRFVETKHVRTG